MSRRVLFMVLLISVMALVFNGCDIMSIFDGDDVPAICGTWVYTEGDKEYKLVINEDGSFVLTTLVSGDVTNTDEGTYSYDDDTLTITNSDTGESSSYPYVLSGDTLSLTASDGYTVEFVRQ